MIGIWIGTYTYQTYEIIANLQHPSSTIISQSPYQTYEIIANLQLSFLAGAVFMPIKLTKL